MISKWDYIGYYFGAMVLTIMLVGFVLLGAKTLKAIWNKKLIEYFKDLLEWNKSIFFFLYGLFGSGIYKIMKTVIPENWSIRIISSVYSIFSLFLIFLGGMGLYILVTDFYFYPTKVITEIYKEYKIFETDL
ncbi:hypothetical protein [Peribacillus huizhouensis]|uniref:Uncharacterized protein n=1 Tax=Peribacillus huizhouensis TaxID=1501239 RepID=A0ABR6CN45_9BACI|nr:hypothetical protein [Peribacillus huizhouensis]MBA9026447.1 hypothetical protein [Peribacillus huizhouensis]